MGLLKSDETFEVELPSGLREKWRMLVTYSLKGLDRMRLRVSRGGQVWIDEHVKIDAAEPYRPIELEREVDGEPHTLVMGWVSPTRSAMRVYRGERLVGQTHEEPWSDGGRFGRMTKLLHEESEALEERTLLSEAEDGPWWKGLLKNLPYYVLGGVVGVAVASAGFDVPRWGWWLLGLAVVPVIVVWVLLRAWWRS